MSRTRPYSKFGKGRTAGKAKFLIPSAKRRLTYHPGFQRTVGNYGRYNTGQAGEVKFHDVDLDDAVVASGGTVTDSICKIAQGTTEITRLGRKCTIVGINWHYMINIPEVDALATPSSFGVCRIILYQDRQCNGATAAVTDILETADYQSFKNLTNSGRFKTLLDKTIVFNYMGLGSDNTGVSSQAAFAKQGSYYKKCNIPLEFSATAGAITEIKSNNIGVLLISKNDGTVFESKIRLRFVG